MPENSNPELKKGGEYILKESKYCSHSYYVVVLNVTEKYYHLQYENGNTEWVEKKDFQNNIIVMEDISSFKIQKEIKKSVEQVFENCPLCNGNGRIPDDNTTSGETTCPICNGSGQRLKTSIIYG